MHEMVYIGNQVYWNTVLAMDPWCPNTVIELTQTPPATEFWAPQRAIMRLET